MDGPDHPHPPWYGSSDAPGRACLSGRTPDDGPPLLSFFTVAEVTLIKLDRERQEERGLVPPRVYSPTVVLGTAGPSPQASLPSVCRIGGGPSCTAYRWAGRVGPNDARKIRSQQAGRGIRSHRAGRTCTPRRTYSPLLLGGDNDPSYIQRTVYPARDVRVVRAVPRTERHSQQQQCQGGRGGVRHGHGHGLAWRATRHGATCRPSEQ